jgi:hypothetical protein
MKPDRRHFLIALAGSSGLVGCGGGGVDPDPTAGPAAAPGMHPLGVATGGTGNRPTSYFSAALTAVSPVTIGGVSLTTQGATLEDGSGAAIKPKDLDVGMTARVLTGPVVASKAQAYSLQVDTQVVGPATWLDSRTVVVLGQRVAVNSATLLAPGLGSALKVWGHLDLAAGCIVATRLDRAGPQDTAMLRGLVGALDPTVGQLQVGALALQLAGPLPAGITVGSLVRAELDGPRADGSWTVTSLRDDALRPPDGLRTELEGRVTAYASSADFSVDGVPVDASQASIAGAAALQAGAEVSVKGQMVAGVLVASNVEAEAAEPLELSGRVQSLDAANHGFGLQGWTVQWSASTRFVQGSAQALRVGRSVEVLAQWVPGSSVLRAIKVSLD